MHDYAPLIFGDAEPIDVEAVALAAQVAGVLKDHLAEAGILALLLVLADLVAVSAPPDEDAIVLDILRGQLHICLARLRALPPLE